MRKRKGFTTRGKKNRVKRTVGNQRFLKSMVNDKKEGEMKQPRPIVHKSEPQPHCKEKGTHRHPKHSHKEKEHRKRPHKRHSHAEHVFFEEEFKAFLYEEAKKMEMCVENEPFENVIHLVHHEKTKHKAHKLGIDIKGKSAEELFWEIKKVCLLQEAKELGISLEGKHPRQIKEEMFELKIREAAQRVGMNIEHKHYHELALELFEHHAEEAKKLGCFPKKRHFH